MRILSPLYARLNSNSVVRAALLIPIKAWLAIRFPGGGIVIGGCGRSGTTLLLGMLSAHSRIAAIPEETWALYPTVQPLRLFRALHRAQGQKLQEYRWCEKTPRNILNVPEILSFFGPKARFLHIVRDGRDVVTSEHPTEPGVYWVTTDRWVHDVSVGLAAERFPQVMRVRYEDLVQRTSETISQVLHFVGEDPDESVLHWETIGTIRSHKAWTGNGEAVHSRFVGRWKRPEYAERVEEFMSDDRARLLMSRLGYL